MTSTAAQKLPPLFTETLGLGVSPTLLGNQRALERRAQGQQVFHMGFGESPFPVPARLKEAMARETHHKQYLGTAGLPELKEKILNYYCKHYSLTKDDYDIIITPGSKLAIYAMQLAYEGDLVLPIPSWVSYIPQARLLHHKVIKVETTLDDAGYYLNPEALRKTVQEARKNGLNPAKIILNSPNNPTGLCIHADNLKEIAAVCADEGLVIIADDIYGMVDFSGARDTIAHYAPERTVITSAMSKHLSLGGWRLGFALVPKSMSGLHEALCQIGSETWSSVASPIQYAALEAYSEHADIESFIADCTSIHTLMNRYIAKHLTELGIQCPAPQGAFYTYPDFAPFRAELKKRNILTSEDLASHLLSEYDLASLPGTAFGEEPERLTLRLSGCDYDGAKALEAYQKGATLDDDFMNTYAPNIKSSCDAFTTFIQMLQE